MKQTVTSAGTSLNQVPALHKSTIVKKWVFGKSVLDYGAGRYPEKGAEALINAGAIRVTSYDPYNIPDSRPAYASIGVCANVLNVIDSDAALYDAIADYVQHINTIAFFSVYQGNKSGEGRYTKGGTCYQRNMRTADYVPLIADALNKSEISYSAILKSGDIIQVIR